MVKTKLDVLTDALNGIQARIEKCTADVQRLKKAEEDFTKGMFGLPSSTPSNKQVLDGDPTRQHAPSKSVFKLLGLKKAESLSKSEDGCPKCKSTKNQWITAVYPARGTAPGGGGRLGDHGGSQAYHCRDCNHRYPFKPKKEEVKKAETYIDEKHPSDREKRYVTTGKPENNLPGDYKAKVSPASQGSEPKAEKVVKDEMGSMAPKMPKAATGSGAPKAPAAPKPPKAPGAMAKMDMSSQAGKVPTGGRPSPGGAMAMSEKVGVFKKLQKKVK